MVSQPAVAVLSPGSAGRGKSHLAIPPENLRRACTMSARSLLRKLLQNGAVQNALRQNVPSVASNGANLVQHRIAANSVGLESGLKCAMAEYGLASRGFTAWHGPLLADGELTTILRDLRMLVCGLIKRRVRKPLRSKSKWIVTPIVPRSQLF